MKTKDTGKALKHCIRVIKSCDTLEKLNIAYSWALNTMIKQVDVCVPYRLIGGNKKFMLQQKYIQILLNVRTRTANRLPEVFVWTQK